jgi:steroid delta-isomerase-like uncharacterized protein
MISGFYGCSKTDTDKTKTSDTISKNKASYEKIIKILESGNVSEMDGLIAADVVDHTLDTSITKKTGLAGVKELFTFYHTAFPDIKTTIHKEVAEDDMLMAYWTVEGTNTGPMGGMPPTNKKIKMDGMEVVKYKDGKIVEHWEIDDNLTMMRQLGLIP